MNLLITFLKENFKIILTVIFLLIPTALTTYYRIRLKNAEHTIYINEQLYNKVNRALNEKISLNKKLSLRSQEQIKTINNTTIPTNCADQLNWAFDQMQKVSYSALPNS